MEPNLTFIHSNYGFLPSTITKLESQGISLTDSVTTVMFTKINWTKLRVTLE